MKVHILSIYIDMNIIIIISYLILFFFSKGLIQVI